MLENKNKTLADSENLRNSGQPVSEAPTEHEVQSAIDHMGKRQHEFIESRIGIVLNDYRIKEVSAKSPNEFHGDVMSYGRAHRKAGGIVMLRRLLKKDPSLIENPAIDEVLNELARSLDKGEED